MLAEYDVEKVEDLPVNYGGLRLQRSEEMGDEVFDKSLIIFLGRLKRRIEIRPTEHLGYEWFEWDPPHQIQAQTVDPLLERLDAFLRSRS